MNSNFRNLAIWVVIGLLLVALFNLFQVPGQSRRGNEISYSELLSQVDSGSVSEVVIQGHRISGTFSDKSRTFTTFAPEDPGLVARPVLDLVRAGTLLRHADQEFRWLGTDRVALHGSQPMALALGCRADAASGKAPHPTANFTSPWMQNAISRIVNTIDIRLLLAEYEVPQP